MDWKVTKALGYSYYVNLGYRILVSLMDNGAYDFVAEKNGNYLKVKVKLAGLKNKSENNSWSISLAPSKRTPTQTAAESIENKGDVDVFLVWLPHKIGFTEVPGDFFVGSKSKSKRIPSEIIECFTGFSKDIGLN